MRTEKELILELHAKKAALKQCRALLDDSLLSEYAVADLNEIIEELIVEIAGVESLLKQSLPILELDN